MAAGVPQTLAPSAEVTTLDGGLQVIARGPVATQEAIQLLSGDGGGFFNANSAHPFENPTPLTNLAELVLIFALGAALTNCFGRMIGSERQGWILLCVMAMLFGLGVAGLYSAELPPIPLSPPSTSTKHSACNSRAETWKARRCVSASPDRRCSPMFLPRPRDGAVNSMHDSFLPLSGGIFWPI